MCEVSRDDTHSFMHEHTHTHTYSSIQGFMQKSDAEKLLLQCSPGTFLIRFSEGDPGGVSVAWVTGTCPTCVGLVEELEYHACSNAYV